MYSFYAEYLITTIPFPPGAPAALAFGAGTPQPPAPQKKTTKSRKTTDAGTF